LGIRGKAVKTGKAGKKKYQAKAPKAMRFGAKEFKPYDKTSIRWLGLAGFYINCHGINIMLDPVLQGFDMPLLIDVPVKAKQVPRLDAVLITHSDNDHYSAATCAALKGVTKKFHSTLYCASLMKKEGLPSTGHEIGKSFIVGPVKIKLTPVDHAWQNEQPGNTRRFKDSDACGFWIETPDGTIWAPGDSRLLKSHLHMPVPDAIFFDFSENEWHFGIKGAVKLANAYPDTPLLLCHWGSVDAPDFTPFNADPKKLLGLVTNPSRVYILAPGREFILKKTDFNTRGGNF